MIMNMIIIMDQPGRQGWPIFFDPIIIKTLVEISRLCAYEKLATRFAQTAPVVWWGPAGVS